MVGWKFKGGFQLMEQKLPEQKQTELGGAKKDMVRKKGAGSPFGKPKQSFYPKKHYRQNNTGNCLTLPTCF